MEAVEKQPEVDHALGHRSAIAKARRGRPASCSTRMAECAWHCGDPGVQYDTTINSWHTCPNSGRINASNPCSEYMFLDDTACNLASINLMKFRQAGRHVRCRAVQDRLPHVLHRPGNPGRSRQLSDGRYRPQQPHVPPARPGLFEPRQPDHERGTALRFSEAAYGLCGAITALLHGAANLASAEMAAVVGPFEGFAQQPRADAPRDADASRRGGGHQRRRPGVSEGRRPRVVGRGARPGQARSAIATPRPPCWPPPARSAS